MQPTRRGQALKPIAALALLLVGVACFGLWRVLGGSEQLPYRSDAEAPTDVQVTRDNTYTLAVPGGVKAMLEHGVPTAGTPSSPTISLQCSFSSGGLANQTLTTSAESTSTRATNTVGTFVAPVTGSIAVSCQGWGAMFVTDGDNRESDTAGTFLLVGSIAFAVGACVMVGVAYTAWSQRAASGPRRSAATPGEHDEVETDGYVSLFGGEHHEVGGDDRGDVGP